MIFTSAAQRGALAAVGGRVDSPPKREKPKARKKLKKRAAYPPSAARCVRRFLLCKTRWLKKETVTNMPFIFQNSKQADEL
jgi:hypothetical protein